MDEIPQTEFNGASGLNSFKDQSYNVRSSEGLEHGLYNVRPIASTTTKDQQGSKMVLLRKYTQHLTAIYDGAENIWRKVGGEEFIFFDGTTNQPEPATIPPSYQSDTFSTTTLGEGNLSAGIRTVGLVVIGVSLGISTLATIWIVWNRKQRVVTASQPEFLYLLCFGSALMSTSAIFASFDESYGYTPSQLGNFCVADQWFFTLGYLIQFGAIFTKVCKVYLKTFEAHCV